MQNSKARKQYYILTAMYSVMYVSMAIPRGTIDTVASLSECSMISD